MANGSPRDVRVWERRTGQRMVLQQSAREPVKWRVIYCGVEEGRKPETICKPTTKAMATAFFEQWIRHYTEVAPSTGREIQ